MVLAGELDGRHVAVKRLLARFYDQARKEIDALIQLDDHPNVVRHHLRLRLASPHAQ